MIFPWKRENTIKLYLLWSKRQQTLSFDTPKCQRVLHIILASLGVAGQYFFMMWNLLILIVCKSLSIIYYSPLSLNFTFTPSLCFPQSQKDAIIFFALCLMLQLNVCVVVNRTMCARVCTCWLSAHWKQKNLFSTCLGLVSFLTCQ